MSGEATIKGTTIVNKLRPNVSILLEPRQLHSNTVVVQNNDFKDYLDARVLQGSINFHNSNNSNSNNTSSRVSSSNLIGGGSTVMQTDK